MTTTLDRPAAASGKALAAGSAYAGSAMLLLGTLAAVSFLVNGYPVYGGQALRYVLAALILFAVIAAKKLGFVRLTGREWLLLIALSGTGLVLFNVFVVEATRNASPAVLGTIVGAVPLVLALAGPLMARRRPSARVLAAAAVVVAGVAVATGLGGASPLGVLHAVGALACEAGFSLFAVPLVAKLGPLRLSAYAVAVSVPVLLAIGLLVDGGQILRVPTWPEAAGLAYLSVVVTAGGFFLWYAGMPRLGVDRAGLFAGLVPVGAIATTMLLGIATPTVPQLVGAALVIAGLVVGLSVGSRRHIR